MLLLSVAAFVAALVTVFATAQKQESVSAT